MYNWATLPNSADDPSLESYFPGGSKTIEPWWFGSLTNDQGMPVEADAGSAPAAFTDAFNRLIVFRGNVVDSNGGIVVRGTSASVGRGGLDRELGRPRAWLHTTKGGIVVEQRKPEGVPTLHPYGAQP